MVIFLSLLSYYNTISRKRTLKEKMCDIYHCLGVWSWMQGKQSEQIQTVSHLCLTSLMSPPSWHSPLGFLELPSLFCGMQSFSPVSANGHAPRASASVLNCPSCPCKSHLYICCISCHLHEDHSCRIYTYIFSLWAILHIFQMVSVDHLIILKQSVWPTQWEAANVKESLLASWSLRVSCCSLPRALRFLNWFIDSGPGILSL